jgi:hypothetical protein
VAVPEPTGGCEVVVEAAVDDEEELMRVEVVEVDDGWLLDERVLELVARVVVVVVTCESGMHCE